MKTITVQLDEREVVISKLPLGKYAELLDALKELPKSIGSLDQITTDQLLEKLPQIIKTSLPELVHLLVIATGMKAEELEELGLDEIVNIVLAVVEVNQYKSVFRNVKKAIASPTTPELK